MRPIFDLGECRRIVSEGLNPRVEWVQVCAGCGKAFGVSDAQVHQRLTPCACGETALLSYGRRAVNCGDMTTEHLALAIRAADAFERWCREKDNELRVLRAHIDSMLDCADVYETYSRVPDKALYRPQLVNFEDAQRVHRLVERAREQSKGEK